MASKRILMVGAIVLGIVMLSRLGREPEVGGHAVSDWVLALCERWVWADQQTAHYQDRVTGIWVPNRRALERQRLLATDPAFIEASQALHALGAEAVPYVLRTTGRLPDHAVACTRDALAALDDTAIPALASALQDGNARVRSTIAMVLGDRDEAAAPAVPALAALLEDDDAGVQWTAANAIADIGPAAETAVPALIVALKDDDEKVRAEAASALNNIGPSAAGAIPALEAMTKDPSAFVRDSADRALARIGGGR